MVLARLLFHHLLPCCPGVLVQVTETEAVVHDPGTSTAQADADSKRETSASAAASATTNASLASEAIKAQSTAWETTNASQTKLFADAKKSQSDLLARLK